MRDADIEELPAGSPRRGPTLGTSEDYLTTREVTQRRCQAVMTVIGCGQFQFLSIRHGGPIKTSKISSPVVNNTLPRVQSLDYCGRVSLLVPTTTAEEHCWDRIGISFAQQGRSYAAAFGRLEE